LPAFLEQSLAHLHTGALRDCLFVPFPASASGRFAPRRGRPRVPCTATHNTPRIARTAKPPRTRAWRLRPSGKSCIARIPPQVRRHGAVTRRLREKPAAALPRRLGFGSERLFIRALRGSAPLPSCLTPVSPREHSIDRDGAHWHDSFMASHRTVAGAASVATAGSPRTLFLHGFSTVSSNPALTEPVGFGATHLGTKSRASRS